MEVEVKSKALSDNNTEVDYQPLIDFFEVLLEWDIKDVQNKKEEKSKKVS